MRSLSHQAKREWLTIPCQRSRALPSAVLRSDRKVRWGTYAAGLPSSQRRAKVPRQHRSLADRVHARLRRLRVVRQRRAVTRAPDGRAIGSPEAWRPRAGSPGDRAGGRPPRGGRGPRRRRARRPDPPPRASRSRAGWRLLSTRLTAAAQRGGHAAPGEDRRRAASHRRLVVRQDARRRFDEGDLRARDRPRRMRRWTASATSTPPAPAPTTVTRTGPRRPGAAKASTRCPERDRLTHGPDGHRVLPDAGDVETGRSRAHVERQDVEGEPRAARVAPCARGRRSRSAAASQEPDPGARRRARRDRSSGPPPRTCPGGSPAPCRSSGAMPTATRA